MDIVWKGVYFSPMTDDGPLTKLFEEHARGKHIGALTNERPDVLLGAERIT